MRPPPPRKILLLMSPAVTESNNLHNLCVAPAPAPCIAVSLLAVAYKYSIKLLKRWFLDISYTTSTQYYM